MTVPYADARKLVDDARARGLELGKALSVAVVDYGGFTVIVERMDEPGGDALAAGPGESPRRTSKVARQAADLRRLAS